MIWKTTLLALMLNLGSLYAAEAPASWRLDYFHTGGLGDEIFSLDRIVIEPLPWPGHPSGYVDPSDDGGYRYEVRNAQDEVIYSRGYSSIFAEWVTTGEARKKHQTFHESLRFPEPEGIVDVVVKRRKPGGGFDEVWRTTVDPSNMYIDPSHPPKYDVIEVEKNGDPRDKVDVLLLGDGYTAEECGEKFTKDSSHLKEVLFTEEPFKSHRKDFNVWGLCPPAAESGVSRPSTGVHKNNPVGSTYDAFGSERYILTFDNRALREISSWAPYEFVEILVNNETYGGGGIFNFFATVSVDNAFADYVFIHEFGHYFAGLADEYYTSSVAYETPSEITEPWEHNATALLDPENLKWKDLVEADTALPTPWPKEAYEEHSRDYQKRRREIRAENRPESEMAALFDETKNFSTELFAKSPNRNLVGAFQGANYDAQAFYRPAMDCIMFTRNEVPFCPVCSRALEKIISLYTPD